MCQYKEKWTVYQSLIFERFSQTLAPGLCYLCRGATQHGLILCTDCRLDLPAITAACTRCGIPYTLGTVCQSCRKAPLPVDRIIAPFTYRYPLSQLVRQLKYRRQTALAETLGQAIVTRLSEVCTSLPECILPVPLHRGRLISRGFNQAAEIAGVVGRELSVPVNNRLLYRIINTRAQVELGPAARKENIKGAFTAAAAPAYKFVALVDDVITTGATVSEAARVLKLAGIRRVEAWACARADSEVG